MYTVAGTSFPCSLNVINSFSYLDLPNSNIVAREHREEKRSFILMILL